MVTDCLRGGTENSLTPAMLDTVVARAKSTNRVLITGVTGFVGSHMAEYALERGAKVYGTVRTRSPRENIVHLDKLNLVECDLMDRTSVESVLCAVNPTHIIHLAAHSYVGGSWSLPVETLTNNIIGQTNLLEAVMAVAVRDLPRIMIAGSSEEYGMAFRDELPLTEHSPLRPMSPYAVSKVAQDMMGYQYFKSYKMPIIRARAFNHEGPRRGASFVTSSFAIQIAAIEAGLQDPVIHVGDLTTQRDYTDVRDIVRGYWYLVTQGEPGEVYNLCSNRIWYIQEVLDYLLKLSDVKVQVLQDTSRMRPSDVPVLRGSYDKINLAFSWVPIIPFERTLKDIISYWRQRVKYDTPRPS